MSRDADRAALFSRLSGWVGVPVEEMEARFDSGDFDPLRPLPIAEDVPEDVVDRPQRAQRGLPRRDDGRVVPPGVSVRAARRPRRRLHGGDHRRGRRPLQQPRLRHVEPRRGRRPGRRRAGVRDDAARAVGRDRLRGRLARQRRPRDQPQGRRQRDGHPAVDRPRPAAVRRAAAADPAAPEAGVHGAQPDRREARRHPPADVAEPRAARVLRGAGRLGDRDEPPDRADHGDGQLPDVRQPLVQPGHQRREVRRAVQDPHATLPTAATRDSRSARSTPIGRR